MVSVSSDGAQGNGGSYWSSLSSDARYVAFDSDASNLVPLDTNVVRDIFVHDQSTGITERVSIDSAGVQGNGESKLPSISSDGRYIAFISEASNLVPLDTNGTSDVFVHDRVLGTTERVSVDSAGVQGNGQSGGPLNTNYSTSQKISADGRYVTFESEASNLVPLDTNGDGDVFVHDRMTGVTERVSVDSAGVQGNSLSDTPALSSDGRYVTFVSYATNLGPPGMNPCNNVFVHDRVLGTTDQVSWYPACFLQLGAGTKNPSISSDGRYVTYWSCCALYELFVYDRATGTTELVSGDSSAGPTISADGRYVAFFAYDWSNLVPLDRNYAPDIFVRDRATGITRRASLASPRVSGNVESNGDSVLPEFSQDGSHLVFMSRADNLVSGDTNGVADIFIGKLRH